MRTDMQHVMTDLETLGNDYDGIITNIGAVCFDPETGELGNEFYYRIDWESSVDAGRTITPSTVKWWMTQPEEALTEVVADPRWPLEQVLKWFKEWLAKIDEPIVWGNGPNFDIGKLEHAYGYYDIPWAYHSIRCVRTIRDLAEGLVDRDDIPFVGDKHNALDDAIWQAKYVSAMWQALRK